MLVEERIYTIEIGKTAEMLRLYEAEGVEIQKKILGHMVATRT